MEAKNVLNEIKQLIEYLNEHTKAYNEGHPSISDFDWDEAYFKLQTLEKESGIILNNSPTQSINYETVEELSKVKHNHKMLSLNKTKSTADVKKFVGNKNFLAMCKMDGLTCSLTYRNGELVAAETRGGGIEGENILHNAKIIPSIPKHIGYLDEIVIDGEIICTYKDFEEFNNQYKNPRNFAAGSIRLLSAAECAMRSLTFVAWEVVTSLYNDSEIEFRLEQKLNFLESMGFTIVPYVLFNGALCNINDIENIINEIDSKAKALSYPIDGVVFKFTDCAYGRSLGETSHHFNNALAYKFYDEVYETKLLNIEWMMGRSGKLTPIAIFEAIDIDGSTVERASMHNISIMREQLQCKNAEPIQGQYVNIYKANAIIPQIYSSFLSEEQTNVTTFEIPKVCPICGSPTEQQTEINTTILCCTNPNCEGKLINQLEHFCGKKGLDIKGISKATLEKLIDWGWVSDKIDIFNLSQYRKEWISKSGFGEKSVDKILTAIEASRNCELHQFISSLGIPLIGSTGAKELAKQFETWDNFISAVETKYNFYNLPNFGFEMNDAILHYDYSMAKEIATNYLNFNKIEQQIQNSENIQPLSDITFVITGKVGIFKNRDELKAKIESLGGKVVGSVSKNTNYLINNDLESTSSKNLKAKSLNIPILSERDFIENFNVII